MTRLALVPILFLGFAARAEQLPLQYDFDRCARAVTDMGGGATLQGSLWMELLIRPDGKVYAAFISNEKGIDNKKLERCLTNQALRWVLPPVPIHYQRVYAPISFAPGGESVSASGAHGGATAASVFPPNINEPPPPEPMNERAAQTSLDISDIATTGERGLAELAVRQYPEAIKSFRAALALKADDREALRGLPQALAESHGDLKEARALAEQLVTLDPQSEEGHEAMIRVCLAAHDNACAVEHWKLARNAKDVAPRSRTLHEELETAVRQAAAELQAQARAGAAAGAPAGAQAQQADPCAQEQGDDKMALCVVKRCLDAGSAEYAKELSKQNNVEYVAGDWRAKAVGATKMLVTREITAKTAPPQQHNAIWLVKLGDQLVMQPTNSEARQITLTHNACSARVSTGQ